MKKAIASFALLATSATSVLANGAPGGLVDTPEISALEGTAALAVLAAVVLLAWERRRRAV